MTRLPLRLRRAGLLLGLMAACSDGPHGPAPTPLAPPRAEPPPPSAEPAPEVAYSTAPAPPERSASEAAPEAGGPEAMEGEAASARTAETAFEPPEPASQPPAPGNFRASASSSSAVDLSWDAAAGADSYEVRYRETGGAWEEWADVGEVTSHTVTELAAATEYEFEVRTVEGTAQSAAATASAATQAGPAPRDPNCEDLPPTISVRATSSSSVSVSWRADRAPACENLFDVSGPGLNLVGTSETSRTVGDREPATEYCYTVSMDGRGSDSDCATTHPPDPPICDITATITATPKTVTSANVSWDHTSTGRCDPIVYDVTGPGLDLEGVTSKSAMPSGLPNCEARTYTVTARENRSGGASDSATATVPACACDITNVRLEADPGTYSVALAWDSDDNGQCETVRYTVNRVRPTTAVVVSNTTDKSATDRNLECETQYRYSVTASGNGDSGSASKSPTTTDCPTGPVLTASITATGAGETTMDVSWGHTCDGACGSVTYTVTGRNLNLTNTTRTSATVTGLSACTSYRYSVTATGDDVSDSASDAGRTDCPPDEPTPTLPSAPDGFGASAASSSSIELSWDSVSSADSYEYVRRTGSGSFPPDSDAVDVGDVTEYEDGGLPSNARYCYRVRTVDGSLKSGWTSESCATTLPETPENFTARAASETSVALSWDSVSGADGYEVRRRKSGGSWSSWSDVGSVTEHTVSGLDRNSDYDFELRTAIGTARSAAASASASTSPPGVPANFAAGASSATAIGLSWDAVSGADSYEVQRAAPTGGFPPDADAEDVGDVTEHEDTGLSPNTGYCYRARAAAGVLKSAWTASACATTLPAAPGNLRAAAASDTSVELSWNAAGGADSYEVRRRESGGPWGDWSDVGDVTSHTVTGLTMETEYEFEVRTVVGTARSAAASARATTEMEPTWIPEDFAAEAVSASEIRLSWEEAPQATGYRLRRRLRAETAWGEAFAPDADDGHRDTELTADTAYCYGVRALGGPEVEWSADVCARTKRAAPANLRATRVSRTGIDIAWDPQPGVSSYWLYGLGTFFSSGDTEVQLAGLDAGETYEFEVVSRIDNVESERSGVLTVTTPNPGGPGDLEAEAGPMAVTLSWPAGSGAGSWSGPGGSGSHELTYKVERRSPAGTGNFAVVAESLTELSYEDRGLTPETEYEYRVRATVELPGFTLHSGTGSTLTVTTPAYVPQNVEAAAVSSVRVHLTWDPVSGARGYELRWRVGDGAWEGVVPVGTRTNSAHLGLTPETTYRYEVRVVAAAGMAAPPWSDPAEATTPRLETPEDLEADRVTPVSLRLRWDRVVAADRYDVERRVSGEEPEDPVRVAAPRYEATLLVPETAYEVRVRSVRSGANPSLWTDWLTVTTPAVTAPATLDIEVWDWTTFEFEWAAAPGAAAYRLRHRPAGTLEWRWLAERSSGNYLVVRGLQADTEYEVEIITVFLSGSGELEAPPLARRARTLPLPDPPATPAALEAEAVSSSSVRLRWQAAAWDDDHPVAGEVHYEVERRTGDGDWTTVAADIATGTDFTDTELTANTGYSYRVRSVSIHTERNVRPVRQESDWSEEVSATTQP